MATRSTVIRRATIPLALVAATLFASSAFGRPGADRKSPAKDAKTATPKFIELMWPEPPETPRVKFLDLLASEESLGRKTKFSESFMQFLTGQKTNLYRIYQPRDIAVSDDGMRVYASDFGQSSIFIFDRALKKVRLIGQDEPFAQPFGLALDEQENLYVVEQEKRRVRVTDSTGKTLRMITNDRLVRPTDVAVDRQRGLVYVADASRKTNEDHTVKVFDREGKFLRTLGNGKGDCQGCLFFPTYVATDAQGRVYVTSTLNARVDVFDHNGKYVRTIGGRGTAFGDFDKPKGVALDSFGNIYVADSGWSNVQIFNQNGDVLLFFGGRGDYPGLLKNPTGIAIDGKNRIYVADYLNYRVTVYELINTTAKDSFLNAEAAPAAAQTPAATRTADAGKKAEAPSQPEVKR